MVFDTINCVGCRTCEIACSYHHKGIFRPSISSIRIIDIPKESAFAISLYEQNSGGHFACDRCEGLEEPLCVKYCPKDVQAELNTILKNFFSRLDK